MPAPVHLSVWFPYMDQPHHIPSDFFVFVQSFPHADEIDWDVRIEPKTNGVTVKRHDWKGCEFAVFQVANLPLVQRFELHIHAAPKDSKKWTDAYHVSWIGKKRHYDVIDLIYPPTGGTQANPIQVEPTFAAYGDIDPTKPPPVSGTLSKDGTGSPISGKATTPVGYDWGFVFMNVASGTYLLTITGNPDVVTTWIKV